MDAENALEQIVSDIKAVTIRLHPEDDLKVKLDEYAKAQQIKAACILTCVGSLQQANIRFAGMPNTDTLPGKFEIVSLTGTLSESGSHFHIAISDETGKTIGGHLKEGSIICTTAEVVIGIFPGVTYNRETDDTFGYKELVVKKEMS